ncbi:hypothetical protein DBY21_09895 [Candidatus Gastranaerophilales bacterium]|nr:MAG: hypothetical protein DBY21_09895 [Candidatus Gastranaerophilales bacterium]
MAVSNNKNIFNNETFLSAAGSAVIGGTGFALAGYDSKPWLKNGMPSDEFVKKVEDKIIAKTDKVQAQKIKIFDKFVDTIDKAKSYEELVEIQLKPLVSQNIAFKDMKSSLMAQVVAMLKNPEIAGIERNIIDNDYMLDIYNGIKYSDNLGELKAVMSEYLKAGSGYRFGAAKESLKSSAALLLSANGINANVRQEAKAMIDASFDQIRHQLKHDSSSVSKEMFDIIKRTAKNMQGKTAALWGVSGGALFGGIIFLINKLCSKTAKKTMVNSPKPDSGQLLK